MIVYYNENNEKFYFEETAFKYENHGSCADIFRQNNIIFKVYYATAMNNCRLQKKVFDLLKNINNVHFIKLIEIYTIFSKEQRQKYQAPFEIDAYTANYYESAPKNILYEPLDYLLENLYEIEILFDMLATNKIEVRDIKEENTVIGTNNITIIDPDLFKIVNFSENIIKIKNKIRLLLLTESLCANAINYEKESSRMQEKLEKELLKIDIDETTNVTYEISKKLGYVKRPIDYFRK